MRAKPSSTLIPLQPAELRLPSPARGGAGGEVGVVMLAEVVHATIAVLLLSVVVSAIYLGFTDLPLAPFLIGEAVGMPAGITLLTLASPRRRR